MLRDGLVLAVKDLRLIFRDKGAVIMGYLVPIVLLLVFGVIYGGMMNEEQNPKVDLLFVDEDHSEQSRRFLDALQSLDVFQITTAGSGEPGAPLTAVEARDMILNGKANLALVYERTDAIPGFQSFGQPVMTLYYDPSASIERQMTAGLVNQAVFLSMGNDLPKEGVSALIKYSGLEGTPEAAKLHEQMDEWLSMGSNGSGDGHAPATMGGMVHLSEEEVVREEVRHGNPFMANTVSGLVVLFLLFSVSFAGASILKEQQEGTIRRLLLAPISVDSIVLGKFLAIGFNSLCQVVVMLAASVFIFRVNVLGNFLPVLVMSLATVAATTSFGMILAALARSLEQLQASITIIVLTMSAVGGSMFPRILMPDWMKTLGLLTINGWAIDGYLDALYRFNGLGSILGYGEAHTFMDFVHNSEALVLFALAVIFGVVASRLFRKRLAGGAQS
jgi:ABC-2 type transport system permease protein